MKSTKYLFSILKPYKKSDNIDDLMFKTGLIRKLCSGLFIWLPTGKKIINKIKNLLTIEMEKIYALEISTPVLQPEHLWTESKRINSFGSELMYLINRNKNKFILSPTNEEIISFFIKNEIISYKQLPLILFQIQNKFRDEIRPRGIIRTKEFLMKDAYSFHLSKKSLKNTYKLFKKTYKKILNKLNLKFFIIKTDSGVIGGKISHEFHVVSKFGEESIIICKKTNKAEIFKNSKDIYINHRYIPKENIRNISYKKSYNEIINKFIQKDKLIKVFICYSNSKITNYKFIALVMKYNHSISNKKIKNIPKIKFPLTLASSEDLKEIIGCSTKFIGIFNLKIPMLIDYNVALMSDFITNENIEKKFIFGVNWGKNINLQEIVDISTHINENNYLSINKSIEIGHIFNLGNKYSKKIKLIKENKNIKEEVLMGCYGIGISRILFSVIENNINDLGIKWPSILLPFNIAILPVNFKSIIVREKSEKLYFDLKKHNFDLLLDDRLDKQFGSMFKDLDILGIPIILIISEKNIKLNLIEIKYRNNNNIIKINYNNIINFLIKYKNSNKFSFI